MPFAEPVAEPAAPTAARSGRTAPALACQAHKFGGSSLADADRFCRVAALLEAEGPPRIAVVSAMRGVTDVLTAMAGAAIANQDWGPHFDALRGRHLATARALDPDGRHRLEPWLQDEFTALRAALRHPAGNDGWFAEIQGLGEVWSSRMLQALLGGEAAGWARLDAREVLEVHPGDLGVCVDWGRSRAGFAAWREAHAEANVVVTGFIARGRDGTAATLGRNGSDHSGAIFAVLFDAEVLTIWTDVDGVLSADPRRVPDAVCLPSLSYAEACELAYFGARVLHPQTLAPAMQRGLPIRIRNTFAPDAPGTWITQGGATPGASPVKGLSLAHDLALLELSGTGLVGVPGTAERMFTALRDAGVSVRMISQGSSEHSICCVLPAEQALRARAAVAGAFAEAIADGQAEGVVVVPDIAVLAAVGDGMVGTPGVAARLFTGLAQARVNVRAIAQGASERNISVAIAEADAERGLRAAHSAFWLSPATLSVGLIGPGNVGRALLAQLAGALPRFASGPSAERRVDLRLRAIADSRRMRLAAGALDPASARDTLAEGGPVDLDRFAEHVLAEHLPHALIVDCSGSDAVAEHYAGWLARGIHVVTPSKHAGSGPLERYRAIRTAAAQGGMFACEATVGAGLPVVQTLRSLLDTGDELLGLEGVLSGTLAWLFNRFDGSKPFSELLREAHALGYTEPDPRDDLSGSDVARKLVILAREAGAALTMDRVLVENLVPVELRTVSKDAFMARLPELDGPMQARLEAADGPGLRYLARFEVSGGARVGLVVPEPGHACLRGRLTDNLVAFRTRRYADNPLVVQGPGAGAEVTAAGVFGDILSIARSLGARP